MSHRAQSSCHNYATALAPPLLAMKHKVFLIQARRVDRIEGDGPPSRACKDGVDLAQALSALLQAWIQRGTTRFA